MKSLLAPKPETASETRLAGRTQTAAGDAPQSPAAPGPLASFARFVLCGGGVGVASSAAVALLAGLMPWAVANALITVASTILCTELHARFTFGAGQRAGWRQHWQSAGSATAAYAVTCVAMFILHLVQSSPGLLTEQIVYLSASGLAGIGRFLILRLFVFAAGRTRSTARVQTTTATASSPVLVPATPSRVVLASSGFRTVSPSSRPARSLHLVPGARPSDLRNSRVARARCAQGARNGVRCLNRHVPQGDRRHHLLVRGEATTRTPSPRTAWSRGRRGTEPGPEEIRRITATL